MSYSNTHQTWSSMISRCQNKNDPSYANYGGRGITVCGAWESFENFLGDMGERPEGKQLDRVDNNLGYFKENCRWVTAEENSNNRRTNRFIEYKGTRQTLIQWARALGITPYTLTNKLKLGMSMEQIEESVPKRKQTPGMVFGENVQKALTEKGMSGRKLGMMAGLSANTVHLILKNKTVPNIDTAAQISSVLGISVSELMGEPSEDHALEECFRRVYCERPSKRKP